MSVAFDGLVLELLHGLCTGGTVVVPTENLVESLQSVDTAIIIPSFLSRLNPADYLNLKTIMVAGEPISAELCTQWARHCTLINGYGPTEATVSSNMAVITPDADISTGLPLTNVTNLVVNDKLRLVPVGVPGELLIGGIGLARGYQNLPKLTQAKFIDNPYGPGKIYRSGDSVRWLPNGTIEFLGRIDNQVKLHGYRIELEEIEHVAGSFTGLNNSVAKIVQETLVLYTSPAELDQAALLKHFSSRLSKKMVPQIIIPVAEFQLTTNGKLDRKALPSIDHLLNQPISRDFEEQPLSGIERGLRQAWAQVLQKDASQINATAHFFKIGGDSISAILLVSRFQQLGYQFTVPLVYQYPRLRQQAQYLQQETNTMLDNSLDSQVQAKGDTVLAQIHQRGIPLAQVEDIFPCIAVQGGLLMNLSSDPSMYLVQMAMKLTGQLDCDQLIQAWASVANQHSPLRTVFIESPSTLSQGFLQVVLSSLPTSWTIAVQPLDSLEAFFIENRQQGFTLQEHMVRNFVFPTADSQVYDIIITIHHSLMDGWSLPLLLQQWMVAYHNPKLAVSPPPTSFTAVVRYICQSDPTLAQAFWTDYLHNAKATPAPLLYPDYIGSPGHASYSTPLNISKAQLLQTTQTLGISIATLFRAAYALVLGRLLSQDDVTFGVILSGRNLNILAMDQVIGPCTNTVPCQVHLDKSHIRIWLQSLHKDQVNMIPFEHSQLTDIIQWNGLAQSGPLFHTLLGFENFPDLTSNQFSDLTLSDIYIHELTQYPLAINFVDQPSSIQVRVSYSTAVYSETSIAQLV
ncbi:hypothetical protein BJ085DRAFT_19510, partial [Dimargaris cristalligena]